MTIQQKGIVVISTTDTKAEALSLSHAVVEAKLAACAQISEITSVYEWESKIEESPEFLIAFKTVPERSAELQAFILAKHSYDTPEVIEVPITAGSDAYLKWLAANTCRP